MADKINRKSSSASGSYKYVSLILFIVAFLILLASLSAATYYYTNKITQETQKVALVGEQAEISQEIARIAFSQESYLTNETFNRYKKDGVEVNKIPLEDFPQNTLFRRTEMKRLADRYNEILLRLEYGGEIADRQGNIIDVTPVKFSSTRANVEAARRIWDYYYPLMTDFDLEAETGYLTRDYATYLMDYTRQYNRTLQRDTARVSELIQEYVDRLQKQLNQIQIAGVVLALILFLLMIFGTLRSLVAGDRKLAEQRRETNQIMQTINEGLFLVDKNLNIGNEYSSHLEEIIGQRNIGGKKLNDVLSKMVSSEDMETADVFIEQLYSEHVVEELISDLNPLNRIEVKIDDFSGYFTTRYLDFKFSRVYRGDTIEKVLASVSDVTDEVLREERAEEEREQNSRQVEMLGAVLNVDQRMLENFIDSTKRRIDEINNELRRPEKTKSALQNKARKIYREVHSMKGEASALKLDSFVAQCEDFESKIKEVQDRPNISGNDFLGMTVILDEMVSLTEVIDRLNARITSARVVSDDGEGVASINTMHTYYTNFAKDIAERNSKEVVLLCAGMDDDILPEDKKEIIQDIAVQMLRNAIVHGIERPLIRERAGKREAGKIQLILSRLDANNAELMVEDDGAGLDFEAIRAKLVERGTCSAENAAKLSKRELAEHMFDSGLSTAKEQGQDAGRGVGMDIIREYIRTLNGKLKVASVPKQYTRFSVVFPLK
ncbi:MAG: Hpt domain-containing protein [Neisseriaceae bacterium]|nr:Hpt domain-containing protein [Neisseriaceae bacterium]